MSDFSFLRLGWRFIHVNFVTTENLETKQYLVNTVSLPARPSSALLDTYYQVSTYILTTLCTSALGPRCTRQQV
jgi:hypothetical protein